MVRTLAVLAALALVVGCSSQPAEKAAAPLPGADPAPAPKADDHAHKPGAHGGIIVPLGRDSYHVEAVFAKGGTVRLYTLGKDEARVQEVEVQDLVGYATAVGSSDPAEEVRFGAHPQPGDPAGKTSLFVGQLPPALHGKAVQVTVNNIRVGAERFRFSVTNETGGHDAAAMPAGATDDDAKKLYLTPGGMYTADDVKANGGTTPQLKYKGQRAAHDDNPQPGDKVCPISKTKANPKFTWVVGGKTYEFCCTPCIDEFVETAKTKPDAVPDPSAFIKK